MATDGDEVLVETIVQRDEFTLNADGQPLICTTKSIHYGTESANPIEIPHESITEMRIFIDKSLTGFSTLGHVFLLIAFFLTALSIQLVTSGAPLLDVITLGTYFSTLLAYPSALMFYKMEVGEAKVLRIETPENRFEFISTEDDCGFEDIRAYLS
ncbi:hypothetical protein OB955_00165 [Halobacteria archaeon AArc-m2/3/4]|uniref:Uncharacterized protein n=1 Tax=Natronoglomus mannanivorans TaxID=2979990 RepID=A0ABT2Q8B0_9EURY|nr:hypothetical protein [Halobacteria archaeon AArc-m2/3/4]